MAATCDAVFLNKIKKLMEDDDKVWIILARHTFQYESNKQRWLSKMYIFGPKNPCHSSETIFNMFKPKNADSNQKNESLNGLTN